MSYKLNSLHSFIMRLWDGRPLYSNRIHITVTTKEINELVLAVEYMVIHMYPSMCLELRYSPSILYVTLRQ